MDTERSPSAAADEPNAKRPKLSPGRKVCFICRFQTYGSSEYHIFIVDLARHLPPPPRDLRPTLRLSYGRFFTFTPCVANSMLYMFEGFGSEDNPGGKSVFTYNLSSIDDLTCNLKLEEKDLSHAPDMHHAKECPIATPTADGKRILVFSSVLHDCLTAAGEVEFELYDTDKRTWEKIPGIPHDCPYGFRTQEFTFVNEFTFLLETDIGMFALNIDAPNKVWAEWPGYLGVEWLPPCYCCYPRVFVINDGLCLTAWAAYDVQEENGDCDRFSLPLECHYPGLITLLDGVNNKECNFCVIQTGICEPDDHPQLSIQLGSCDPIKYKQQKLELGSSIKGLEASIKITSCFRFPLYYKPHETLSPRYLFPM